VNLEELVNERNYILGELKAYEDLQVAMEKIKKVQYGKLHRNHY
jgi:hypothetical protein